MRERERKKERERESGSERMRERVRDLRRRKINFVPIMPKINFMLTP